MTFYSDLPMALQKQMKQVVQEKFLDPNEILIEKGGPDQKLYLLESGELNVKKK